MKTLLATFASVFLLLLSGCTTHREFRERDAITDTNLNGTWLIKQAEFGGQNFPMPAGFELQIADNRYRAGAMTSAAPPSDRGRIILFGDELAGQAARADVVGEDGPNKGKRFPAIYRFNGRELEVCYDLAEKERPTEFVSREGTRLLRVTYVRK
jgi:uncharacterized protein (TIGR03067 family)